MSGAIEQFERLLDDTLIEDFVGAPDRNMHAASFRRCSLKLSDYDAAQFMRSWNSGMLDHYERGRYRFRENGSIEQFFSSGPKMESPRSFSLWLEPVISVGAMGRLHFDFGWPEGRIATQSRDGAFDVIAFRPDRENEHIAGEVKKSASETQHLIELMTEFGLDPQASEPRSGRTRNAFKKVSALRKRQPPIFWAIGPDRVSEVFKVRYFPDGQLKLIASDEGDLVFGR